ncbi:MAG: peptidoglycan DD-metalloendopeptidase family protein [Gammaproteobacteria bacterium]|nr:peptidoglycan DD-metalloendopeptidase family protein [Gammaproteobacteria bacterium]
MLSPRRPAMQQRIVLFFILSVVVAGSAAQDKQQQLQQLRSQMQEIQSDLSDKQKRRQAMQQELRSAEKKIGRQSRELKRLDQKLATQKQRIRVAKMQQGLNRNSLVSQRHIMGQQIRAAYAIGRQDRLKLLLNQQDPAVAGRLMIYHDYFNRSRVRQLDLIQDTLSKLQHAEKEMTAEEEKMRTLQARKQQEKSGLERSRSGRKKLIVQLNRKISSGGARLKELQEDEKRLQNLLAKIQTQSSQRSRFQSSKKPFQSHKGKMSWPTKGKFKARFGAKKRGGLKWDGVLISAPEGVDVKAVYHGKVVFADWLRGFGLMLILDHGDGYMTLYGHNQSLTRQAGELVGANEVVAVLGDSGGQTEPGVYFAMRHKGKPINPAKWFK